jgi:hypothetical protein
MSGSFISLGQKHRRVRPHTLRRATKIRLPNGTSPGCPRSRRQKFCKSHPCSTYWDTYFSEFLPAAITLAEVLCRLPPTPAPTLFPTPAPTPTPLQGVLTHTFGYSHPQGPTPPPGPKPPIVPRSRNFLATASSSSAAATAAAAAPPGKALALPQIEARASRSGGIGGVGNGGGRFFESPIHRLGQGGGRGALRATAAGIQDLFVSRS